MSANQDPPGRRPRRLSPDELAQEVAKRLKMGASGRGQHRQGRRFDVVTISRIVMALGVILIGIGAAFAVAWIGRLGGYETTGTVIEGTPAYGCPGEPEIGALFTGETVHVVGRTDEEDFYVVRDERGPGDLVYAGMSAIGDLVDPERLPVRSCEPRTAAEIAAAETPTTEIEAASTTLSISVTTILDTATTTAPTATDGTGGPTPRRGIPSPGAPPISTPTAPGSPGPSITTPGSSSTTTTRQPATTSSTSTTRPPATTSSTTTTTTSTTTTTTTTSTNTPPEPTTTITMAETTTTEAPTTTVP